MRVSDIMAIVEKRMTPPPIARALELGTLNALDRSKQYPLDDAEKLKRAINEAWTKIHHCEQELGRKDQAISGLLVKAESNQLWVRILRYTVSAEAAIIGFLAFELFSRLH